MKAIITLAVAAIMSTAAMAQNDSIPEWQRLTKREERELRKADKEQQYRERMRAKALKEAKANREEKLKKEKEMALKPAMPEKHWFAGIDMGSGMAFGDDSWNVFDEFSEASGFNMSGYVGYHFNKMMGARLRMRYLKQYNRVNLSYLELIEANAKKPEAKQIKDIEQYFPNKGFYGYNTLAVECEYMLNLSKLFSATHNTPWNVYMLLGTGFNTFSGYDKNVENWQKDNKIFNGWSYPVDTKSHTQWLAVGGLLVDYRLGRNWSVNFDLSGTTTTDNMEGVISEEWYDVYITWGLGVTYHF